MAEWKVCPHNGGDNLYFIDLGFLMVDVMRETDQEPWGVQTVEGCGYIETVVKLPDTFEDLQEAQKKGITLARKLLRKASRKLTKANKELK